MKKWFFSSNGEVTSALSFNEAKEFLNNNPDAYGWNASFKQWKPVSCINEFVGIIPATIPTPLISKEISENFQTKKLSLESKLLSLEDSIKHSLKSLVRFEQQIQNYKDLTYNLNDNVKSVIDNSEKKYETLNSKLTNLREVLDIAKIEMLEVVEGFNHKMQTNDILMPACIQSSSVHYLQTSNVDDSLVNNAKLAQENLVTPPKTDNSSKLAATKTPKVTTQFNQAKKSPESSVTITKVYRGVEYKGEKQL